MEACWNELFVGTNEVTLITLVYWNFCLPISLCCCCSHFLDKACYTGKAVFHPSYPQIPKRIIYILRQYNLEMKMSWLEIIDTERAGLWF